MARKTNNKILHKAKESKSDEFYTQYCDIERELIHYSSQFKGKTVYCNCDDPAKSNFIKYFVDNFHILGLKKLITTCYAKRDNSIFDGHRVPVGYMFVYNGEEIKCLNELPSIVPLQGDGDFRSEECKHLLAECDIVVTNPPFSLFREFISQIMRYEKKFLVIGNINAITYKEIFELIQNNKVWLGHNLGRGISGFIVPEHYELYGTEARIDENGQRIVSSNNCLWLTNLESSLRNEFIPLSKKFKGNESSYPVFDNFEAINVNKTLDIPADFAGAMGVPITFLHKYNPNQFQIIRFRKGYDEKDLSINGKCPYFRILIRNLDFTMDEYERISGSLKRNCAKAPAKPDNANPMAIQLSLF